MKYPKEGSQNDFEKLDAFFLEANRATQNVDLENQQTFILVAEKILARMPKKKRMSKGHVKSQILSGEVKDLQSLKKLFMDAVQHLASVHNKYPQSSSEDSDDESDAEERGRPKKKSKRNRGGKGKSKKSKSQGANKVGKSKYPPCETCGKMHPPPCNVQCRAHPDQKHPYYRCPDYSPPEGQQRGQKRNSGPKNRKIVTSDGNDDSPIECFIRPNEDGAWREVKHVADTGATANVIPLAFLKDLAFKEREDSAEIARDQVVSWISKDINFKVEKVVKVDFKLRAPGGKEVSAQEVTAYVVDGPEWKEFFISKATLKKMGLLPEFLE